MSIRKLDWSPLDLDKDPVYADPDVVSAAQKRYEHIATTIDDATAKLETIVDTNSESLAGQYVQGLKSEASSLLDRLRKAAVRYHDVADEIGKYEPDLEQGLSETAGALTDADEAKNAQTKAHAMPDPQKDPDGTTSSEEEQKGTDKTKATSEADARMAAAKARLNNALDALDVAGKRFGDAVNCKKYDDGLSDTLKDKIDAVLKKISTIFSIIGMVLGALAIFIPGVDALVLAGVAAGAVSLVADSVLYADGQGSLADVLVDAFGLGLAGAGGIASLLGKGMANDARTLAIESRGQSSATEHPPRLGFAPDAFELRPWGESGDPGRNVIVYDGRGPDDYHIPDNAATGWTNMSDWFNNPATNWLLGKFGVITPEIGFLKSALLQGKGAWAMWGKLFSDPLDFAKSWGGVIGGWSGYRDLAAINAAIGNSRRTSPLWFAWGGLNAAFVIGQLGYSGNNVTQPDAWLTHPGFNPSGAATN